jgi:FkbM family methyltransferase
LMGEQPASSGVPINNLLTSLLPSPWLLLDCLPAAHLLHGADLSHTHVLLARVVLGAPDTSPSGSTLAELQTQLAPQGYQLAACFAERNTQLAKTLWLRDPDWLLHQEKAKADQALSEQSKVHEAEAKSRQQELQALLTAKEEAKQANEQLQAKLEAEAQGKQDLQAQNVQALVQAAELTQANEESQTQLKAAQAELQQAKIAADTLADEHLQRLDELQFEILEATKSLEKRASEIQKQSQELQLQEVKMAGKVHELNQIVDENKNTKKKLLDSDARISDLNKKIISIYKASIFKNQLDKEKITDGDSLVKASIWLEPGRLDTMEYQQSTWTAKLIIRTGSKADLSVCKQIFERADYDIDWLPQGKMFRKYYNHLLELKTKPVILDCGANIGASVKYFLGKYPRAQIIAVEPEFENLKILDLNTAGYDVKIYPGGVFYNDEGLFLTDPGNGEWAYRTTPEGTIRVPTIDMRTLFAVASDSDKVKVCAAKIDIEGAEQYIFADEFDWLDNVAVLMIELHDWMLPGKATSAGVLSALSKHGFEVIPRGENLLCFNPKILSKFSI